MSITPSALISSPEAEKAKSILGLCSAITELSSIISDKSSMKTIGELAEKLSGAYALSEEEKSERDTAVDALREGKSLREEYQKKLSDLDVRSEKFKAEISQKTLDISTREAALATRIEKQNEKEESHLSDIKDQKKEIAKAFAEKEREIAAIESDLDDRERSIGDRADKVTDREIACSAKEESLKTKHEDVDAIKASLTEKQSAIDGILKR